MTHLIHRIYIYSMAFVVIAVSYYIATTGYSYYSLPIEERFYHPSYDWFKPSGLFGQGLGVIGTAMIAFGVAIYIARKRYGIMSKFIRLKYLLEFHIFLCTLGPILILFHTTFKFGGIVSIAFWSMVAVVASGVIGRFIYVQIPHTIDGRQLSAEEIDQQRSELINGIASHDKVSSETLQIIRNSNRQGGMNGTARSSYVSAVKKQLKLDGVSQADLDLIISQLKEELSLARKINGLQRMKKLFSYWHVVHMPFAIILLIIVIIHVIVTITLGYKWIF